MKTFSLYYYDACPFCQRVLHAIRKLGADVELRNVQRDPANRKALINGGGKSTVPCLKIEQGGDETWMYESADIVKYLSANA